MKHVKIIDPKPGLSLRVLYKEIGGGCNSRGEEEEEVIIPVPSRRFVNPCFVI